MRRTAGLTTIACGLACSLACSDGDSDQRQEGLQALAQDILLPAYRSCHEEAVGLADRVATACVATSSASQTAARDSFVKTFLAFKRAEVFGAGPLVDLRLDRALDFWPARTDSIQALLDDAAPLPSGASLGAAQKGLPVLDVLIFDDDFAFAPRRCRYTELVAQQLVTDLGRLLAAWEPDDGGFATELAAAGESSQRFTSTKQAIDLVVNELIEHVAVMESMKVGTPLGRKDGGEAQPGEVEAPASGLASQALQVNLQVALDVYRAVLSPLLRDRQSDLDTEIVGQFARSQQALDALSLPLSEAVVAEPEIVQRLFEELQALLRFISADVAVELGVTVTFSDNDGD